MDSYTWNLPLRGASCRGVSFEAATSRATPAPQQLPGDATKQGDHLNGRWVWLPSGQAGSITSLPKVNYFERNMSVASSHFCDIEDEEQGINTRSSWSLPLRLASFGGTSRITPQPQEYPGDASEQGEEQFDIEEQKQHTIEGKMVEEKQAAKKPAVSETRLSVILLDQGLFTVYKQLFAAVFIINMTMLFLAIAGHFNYGKRKPALFSIINILLLTLCRSEATLRIVFWLAVKVLGRPIVPITVKLITTSFLQSVGGIHSSCGVSSVAWLIYALILAVNNNRSTKVLAVASIILALLFISCLAAFPLVRHMHHNVFERTHRFAGWIALALVWVFVFETVSGPKVTSPEIWLTAAVTFFTILPWITVRRVSVSITAPSGHASVIKFPGGIPAGILGRISRSPLSEWHAFGIISDGKDNHTMLAGAVGDFTTGLVSNPPSHLWVRSVRFAGLPYLVNMYSRAVLVATGSGICVFLSFLMQPSAADVCVVWVAKEMEKNFGKEIMDILRRHPAEKVIMHDTSLSGRPNVASMTIEAVKKWNAEMVVVTSNPRGSKDVVDACKSVGIPAFGPIWDS